MARRERPPGLPPMREDELLSQVLHWMGLCGWRRVHFRPARTKGGWRAPVQGDGVGWPDVVAVHEAQRRLLAAELKRAGEKPTAEQYAWLRAFAAIGAEIYVWDTGDDWDEIARILREGP